MTLEFLASKVLPDGTLLLAIEVSSDLVLLSHQILKHVSFTVGTQPFSTHSRDADIQMISRQTKLISRKDFDAGGYEKSFYAEQPKPISKALQLAKPKVVEIPPEIEAMVKKGKEFCYMSGPSPNIWKLKKIADMWKGLGFINHVVISDYLLTKPAGFAQQLIHAGIPAAVLEDTDEHNATRVVGVLFSHDAYDLETAEQSFQHLREMARG